MAFRPHEAIYLRKEVIQRRIRLDHFQFILNQELIGFCLKLEQRDEAYSQQALTDPKAFSVHQVIHRSGGK